MDIFVLLRLSCRFALAALGAAGILCAAVAGVLAWPQPFFPHTVEAGRLSLHSDRPFDAASGREVLAGVELRLASAPAGIGSRHSTYRIFIANAEWLGRLTFLDKYGAGGVNYHLLPHHTFLRQSDIGRNRMLASNGDEVAAPRTLAYFAAHEIAHGMVSQRIGPLARWRLPVWIDEGLADYVGFAGDVDIEALTLQLHAGHGDLDPAASGLYARYRLLVAHMLEREGWTVDELLTSAMPQEDAERRLQSR